MNYFVIKIQNETNLFVIYFSILNYLQIYEELQNNILITCTNNNKSYFIAPFLADQLKALYREGFQNKLHIKYLN